MSQPRSLTATNLRLILTVAIGAIIAIGVGGFYFASGKLKDYAAEVSQVVTTAQTSASNVERLEQTQRELATYEEAVERAAKIVAESSSYQYQDQIINDLTRYAERAGISIVSFNFDSGTAGATSPSPTPTTPAAPMGGPAMTPGAGAATPTSSLKSISVTVQLEPTVAYVDLLQFMRLVEQNLTKMQLAQISLSQASGGNQGQVAGQALVIEVYVN